MKFRLPHELNFRYRSYARDLKPIVESKEVRTYTELGLALIALLVFGWFAIRPTALTIITLRKEHAAIQAIVESFDRKIADLSEAQTKLAQHRALRAILAESMPDSPYIGETIRILEGIADKHAVTIDSLHGDQAVYRLTAADPTRPAVMVDLAYNLTLVGETENLLGFSQDLHTARRLFLISSLTLSESSLQVLLHAPHMEAQAPPPETGEAAKQPVGKEEILEH